MELEGIMLSEISQAEKYNYHMVSLTCGTQGIAQRTIGEGMEIWREEIREGDEPWETMNKLRVSEGRGVWGGTGWWVLRRACVAWCTGCYTQVMNHGALHQKLGMYCMVTNIIQKIYYYEKKRLVDDRVEGPFLGSLFCFIDLCVCFCTNTMLSWWSQLCNIVWSQATWCPQLFHFHHSLGNSGSFLVPYKI